MLRHLALLPFRPGARISRSLCLMFLSPWGIRTQAVMPVDDKLDLPDPDNIAGLWVIDLAPAGDGTIVHLRLLPGLVEGYRALVERALVS